MYVGSEFTEIHPHGAGGSKLAPIVLRVTLTGLLCPGGGGRDQ